MIIKHKKMMDVAFSVEHQQTFKSYPGGYTKYRGKWLNLGYVKSWSLGVYQVIDIKDENRQDWLICDDEDEDCLRFSQWTILA